VVWFFSSHLLFFGALAFLLAATQREYRSWTAGLLLLLGALFFPLTRTLTAGQLNVILLFLLSAAVCFLNDGRERAGGVFLGVATMVKVSPGFLILFLAWKRRWKALAASLVTVGVLLLFSVVVLGPRYGLRVHREAMKTFGQMSYGSSTWSQYGEQFHVARANISPSSVIYRLLLRDPGYASDPSTRFEGLVHAPGLAKVLSIITAIGCIGLLAWVTRSRVDGDFPLEFSLAMMVMLLVPSLFWDHYLTLLMIPFCFLIALSLQDMSRPMVVLWVVAAAFLSRPYGFFDGRLYSGWGTLRLAPHLFAVLIIGAILICEIRRRREVSGREA
jgi:hypothetical protein